MSLLNYIEQRQREERMRNEQPIRVMNGPTGSTMAVPGQYVQVHNPSNYGGYSSSVFIQPTPFAVPRVVVQRTYQATLGPYDNPPYGSQFVGYDAYGNRIFNVSY